MYEKCHQVIQDFSGPSELRLCTSKAKSMNSIRGQGTKKPHAKWCSKIKKKKKSALHSAVKPSLKKSKSKNIYINILTL